MATIKRITTVARDGLHNGFTDLQYWQSLYWTSYRKGSSHASLDGEAIVNVSQDRNRFREVASIKVVGDNRDPKMFPISDDRMAMTIPSWQGDYQAKSLRQFITFTHNGYDWETPQRILDDGHWLWRIREHNGQYFGLVQRLIDESIEPRKLLHHLFLMKSTDLLNWENLGIVGDESLELNESDIHFCKDGTAWIVARSIGDPGYAYFAHAKAPYTDWQTQSLGVLIHAPIFLEHDGAMYVAGRCRYDKEGVDAMPWQSGCAVWKLEFGKVTPVLRMPAWGDCSYPGLIKDPDGRICMSYYSQHAYFGGVINSSLSRGDDGVPIPDDVYFAELEL